MKGTADICIVGGGIAGLTLARELALRGRAVTILDRGAVGEGTAWVAAGMLAPLVEARIEEERVTSFGAAALAVWPDWAAALERETGLAIDHRTEGTIIAAVDRDQLQLLRHAFAEHRSLGLDVTWLDGDACRELEPMLAPNVVAGILSLHDHQLNGRLLLQALRAWCSDRGEITINEDAGEALVVEQGSKLAVRHASGEIESAVVVVASGASGEPLRSVAPSIARSLRPVKGQILRLAMGESPVLTRVVRTPEVYFAPKSDGTLVVGASSEDRGFDRSITAGEIYEILRSAREALPIVHELAILETSVGFRPATLDHEPLLGRVGREDLYVAGGYYRHGILFAPLAARLLADLIVEGRGSQWTDHFSPERFDAAAIERT